MTKAKATLSYPTTPEASTNPPDGAVALALYHGVAGWWGRRPSSFSPYGRS